MNVGPLRRNERIRSVDVLRGFALLGIIVVNGPIFALPMAAMLDASFAPAGLLDRATAALISILAEAKFISTFSLLFGFGLAMQRARRLESTGSFAPFGVRRMLILGAIGFLHVLFLWFGDVLFIYAAIGLAMIPLLMVPAPVRLGLGLGAIAFSSLAVTGLAFLGTIDGGPAAEDPGEVLRGFKAMSAAMFDPTNPIWISAETLANSEGPWTESLLFRMVNWAFSLIAVVLGYGWHVLGMILIGSWMHDRDFFGKSAVGLRNRLAGLLLPIGLVLAFTLGAVEWNTGPLSVPSLSLQWLQGISAALISIGMVSAISRLVELGRMPLAKAFETVGRMSLSAYLLESLLFCAVVQHWGLGWFGRLGSFQILLLSIGIYVLVVLACTLWSRFRPMGPMEWLWRQGSYLGIDRGLDRGRRTGVENVSRSP